MARMSHLVMLVVSIGAVMPPSEAVGQGNQPSLQETREWIAQRMPELARQELGLRSHGSTIEVVTVLQGAQLDRSCMLRLTTETSGRIVNYPKAPVEPPSHTYTAIPLSAVDGNGIYAATTPADAQIIAPFHYVRLPIAGGLKLVRDSSVSAKGVDIRLEAFGQIGARDDTAAQRIVRAIRRAVQLCGGRFEKF